MKRFSAKLVFEYFDANMLLELTILILLKFIKWRRDQLIIKYLNW